MAPRRPPDILRKSHAHSDGDARSRDKRALERALGDVDAPDEGEQGLLIDLDGVVYLGDEAVPGAREAIAWLEDRGVRHLFVTNTTSRPREAIVERLARLGIAVAADEILAPPGAAASWLAERGYRRVCLLVPEATASAFAAFDSVAVDAAEAGGVDAVVVGDLGRQWTYERLNSAFRLLMARPAPKLVALGMTRYWHAPDGLRLDTAPFVMALSHASGIEPVVLGKPSPEFFAAAIERLDLPAGACTMIGDDIAADIGGAQAAGLKGILVKTGKFRSADLEGAIEPDLVIDSLADLPRRWPGRASF
jgi:HAD superfamily hydrolase (TIGR01458 family)